MSNDVSSTLVLPEITGVPGIAIRSSSHAAIAEAQNTLFELTRGALVCDGGGEVVSSGSSSLLETTSDVARYRVRTCCGRGYSTEDATVRFYVEISDTGGAPSATIVASISGGDSATYTYSGGGASGWVSTSKTIGVRDDTSPIDIDVQITTETDCTVEVYSIVIEYERARSVLLTPDTGAIEYTSGFCPLDLDEFTDDDPCSAWKLRTEHRNARALYARGWQLVTSARILEDADASEVTVAVFDCYIPHGHTSVTFDLYLSSTPSSVTVAGRTDADTDASPSSGWNTLTLTVEPDSWETFVISGVSLRLESVCARLSDCELV